VWFFGPGYAINMQLSFSYVFQLYGRVTTINREEMRAFKKVWAELDTQRTGYLRRRQYSSFFAVGLFQKRQPVVQFISCLQRLTGVFDVRIYPEEARIPALLRASRPENDRDRMRSSRGSGKHHYEPRSGVDLDLLQKRLDSIDSASVAARRSIYAHLYYEATLTEEPQRGISFTNMLILLAHYKLMKDSNALQSVTYSPGGWLV